jgi:energy-coupling factor transport system permease protein
MFNTIPIGIYYPGDSLIHRLQARTKLLVMFWLVIFFILANHHFWHFVPYFVVAVLLFATIALAGISPLYLWQRMWLLVVLALLGVFPTILFYSASETRPLRTLGPLLISYALLRGMIAGYGVLLVVFLAVFVLPLPVLQRMRQRGWFKFIRFLLILLTLFAVGLLWITRSMPSSNNLPVGPIVITYDGVWLEITLFVVFLALFAFSLLLTMTTSPISLIEGLTKLLTPLRWLRLPVDDFALMTLIALRFIPTLIEEAELLVKAQMARGADLTHGSMRERLQSLAALFIPFIQATLRRAADLATALEARGYEVDGRQTFLHETSFRAADYLVMGTVAVVTIGALLL